MNIGTEPVVINGNPGDASQTNTKDSQSNSGTMALRERKKTAAFQQEVFASTLTMRLQQTPGYQNPNVKWKDENGRGNSLCVCRSNPKNKTTVKAIRKILKEANVKGIEYKNGVPDFSPVAKAEVKINPMYGGKGKNGTKARNANFAQADEQLAKQLNEHPEEAEKLGFEAGNITAKDIKKYRTNNKLTWHELNDVETIQLVPRVINETFGHLGGVGEINEGAYEPGGFADQRSKKRRKKE